MLQKLPVNISEFSILRSLNCLYVDKTEHVYNLITGDRYYFLSRPRRFGKSLLVSTLQEALEGNKVLFEGLWIAQSNYRWQKHAVIKLDFSAFSSRTPQAFLDGLVNMLQYNARTHGITLDSGSKSVSIIFFNYLNNLHERYGHIAILIDEYDSPLLHNISNLEVAKEIRTLMHEFFRIIKAQSKFVDFVFITGVSAFAKAGIFSGLNNLNNITLDKQYATICGYTDQEIDSNYLDYVQKWAKKEHLSYDQLRTQIKEWYNGYRFGNSVPTVYNPFSLTYALSKEEFRNFWFESGTPTFLIEILRKEHHTFDPNDLEASSGLLNSFEIDAISINALLFQTGYLTITGRNNQTGFYTLDYPNHEVKISLNTYLFAEFAQTDLRSAERISWQFLKEFDNRNLDQVMKLLTNLFAHIPYQLYTKKESFYHALLQMALTAAGARAQSEYTTDRGRIDLVLELKRVVYVIEIKFNSSAQAALDQIKQHGYPQRFASMQKLIVLLGINFKREAGNFEITYVAEDYKDN